MIDSSVVLELIKSKGPVIPINISKQVQQDLLFTSAILSELVSQKKLKLTYIKVGGGSPLYYLPGQEDQLKNFIHYLPEKDRKTVVLLEKKRILRDSELGKETRISLRQIKDFAFPLQVTIGGNKELFWKWHLLTQEEATNSIKESLGYKVKKKEVKKEEPVQQIEEKKAEVVKKEEPKVEAPVVKEEIIETPAVVKEEPAVEPKPEVKRGRPKKIEVEEPASVPVVAEAKPLASDPFLDMINAYFDASNISVLETSMVKKGKEYDFVLQIASIVGPLHYYCRAKKGKRINEGDLSASFILGQSKKLPTLFLSTGELTKKAKEFLEKELPGVRFKTIDHGS